MQQLPKLQGMLKKIKQEGLSIKNSLEELLKK